MASLDFTSLQQHIAEETEAHPEFAAELDVARAEVEFAIGLARLREKRRMTQVALARAAGIKQPMLAPYERGHIPTVPTLQRLALALDAEVLVTPDTIKFVARRRKSKSTGDAGI